MKKIFLACLILFISIAAVSASEDIPDIASNSNNEYAGSSLDDNLQDEMPVDELGEGDNDNLENAPIDVNDVSVTGSGDSEDDASGVNIDAENMSDYYNANPVYKFKILDSDDQPVGQVPVKLHIVGKIYTVYTNLTGEGSLKLNLKPGSYPITVEYVNKSVSRTINLFSLIDAENMNDYYNTKPVYKFKILESDGQPIKSAQVKLRIVGKVYTVYTNAAGEGSLKLNLKPGSYPITV